MPRRCPLLLAALLTARCSSLAVGQRTDAAVERPAATPTADGGVARATTWLEPPAAGDRARERPLLFDFDLDGLDDVCARFGDAYGCARNTGESRFEGWQEVPGFLAAATDFTVASARAIALDEDGYLDLCALDARGVACRFGDGRGRFTTGRGGGGGALVRTLTDRAAALAAEPAGGTLLFLRLRARNREATRDACARFPEGFLCVFNEGLGAFSARRTARPPFGDGADGWQLPLRVETLRGGDVTGDGSDDACARGGDGVYCARFDEPTSHFEPPTRWSAQFQASEGWDDARHRRSFALADVNGDGAADWCGRGPRGVHCALAAPGARRFDGGVEPVVAAWRDAAGWGSPPPDRSDGLLAVDLDHDRRVDLCALGPPPPMTDAAHAVWCARSASRAEARFDAPHLAGLFPALAGPAVAGVIHRGRAVGFCAIAAEGGVVCTGRP